MVCHFCTLILFLFVFLYYIQLQNICGISAVLKNVVNKCFTLNRFTCLYFGLCGPRCKLAFVHSQTCNFHLIIEGLRDIVPEFH